jgi:cytochrome c biogenesis protein CcmG/thiol:disulfide interchange protein DsbE
MRARWILAAVGALGLAFVTVYVPKPWTRLRAPAPGSPSASVCPANAKPANLNFTMKDMSGRDVKLADYKGKVILLDFWATWCGPCKYEIPGFVELQGRYGRQGLQVIGVSVDDTMDKLQPFADQYKINYPVLQGLGHDDVQEAFGPIWGIPINVLISRDGRICSKHTGLPPSEGQPLEKAVKDAYEAEIKALLNDTDVRAPL